ncbi:MAG: hypothetical protein V5A57_02295 [Candidatus Paceibacterota bacterium]
MTDKILDIVPPQKADRPQRNTQKKGEFWTLKRIILLSVIVVLFAAVFSYLNFAKAEVKIWPKTELVDSKELVTVEESADKVTEDTIPGKFVFSQVKDSQQFNSSKITSNQKARGKIRVYNDSNQQVTLIPNTGFMSASQKVYKSPERITIPAAKYRGGEKVSGHVDVEVVAAEVGEEYNVKETKFSVPGLNGSTLYHQVYAETITDINGGFEGKDYKVTEQDVKEARKKIEERLKKEGKEKLKGKDYIIFPETITQNATETFISAQPGMKTDKFTIQEKVKTKAFAFKREDLKQLVEKLARKKMEGGKIYEPSLKLDYEASEVYPEKGRVLINVNFSAKVYSPVEEKEVKAKIRGMSLASLNSWFNNKNQIAKTEINTWPYWMRSLPSSSEKVEVKVLID